MLIREIQEKDALAYVELRRTTIGETKFMMREPDEYNATEEQQLKVIQKIHGQDNSNMFVAEDEGKLIGFAGIEGGRFKRNRFTGYLVMGILQKYHGQGLGSQLMEKTFQFAREKKMHRLELTVMTHNEVAIGLYKKFGFEIEGTKREDLFVDGKFVSEYYMGIVLE